MPTIHPVRPPFGFTVEEEYKSPLYEGDVIRLTHDGKRSVMRIGRIIDFNNGFEVWATRKQWDRKGRMTQRGKRQGYYFIPRGTDITVIAMF